MRIAGGSAGGGPGRSTRPVGVMAGVLVLIGCLVTGYAGQSLIEIGAPSHVSVSAGVIGSSGGIGNTQPVRVRLQVGVVNSGDAQVRVVGRWSDTITTAIRSLTPSVVEVPGGTTAEFAVDVALACTWPDELTLPTLRLEEPNGEEEPLQISGASALTDACLRGVPAARPIGVISATPIPSPRTAENQNTQRQDGRLELVLNSPTGRKVRIVSLRAGGVPLTMTSDRPGEPTSAGPSARLAEGSPTTLVLTAPKACPKQWLITGVPTSLRLELASGSAPLVQIGRPLATWLLATACAADGPS